MNQRWTISRRVVAMASLLCAMSVLTTFGCLYGLRQILTRGQEISEKSLPGVIHTSTMNYLPMINMVRLYRLLDSTDAADRKAIEEATLEDTRKFRSADKIYASTIRTSEERAEYEKLGRIHEHYLSLREKYLSIVDTDREQAKKILTVDMVAALNDFSTQTLFIMGKNANDGDAHGKELVAV